jgi:DNA repair protein RadC
MFAGKRDAVIGVIGINGDSKVKGNGMKIKSEEAPTYGDPSLWRLHSDDEIIAKALEILIKRFPSGERLFQTPRTSREFFTLKLAGLEHEVFSALWLTAQNSLIIYEELFRGTLTQTSVYPREVLKAALKHNAGAVIFAHNHPSGHPEPSHADKLLTTDLKNALTMIDVRVLDHIVVGGAETVSFAERGLI